MNKLATVLLALLAAPVIAQETNPVVADDTPAQTVTVHGYLTQAYATSNGEQILGIPTEGTTDYRRAAVLIRFTPTKKDSLVIQFAHRRLGLSPTLKFEPDVTLDWAFYERRLGENTSVRVGRLPQPMGIQNETRYVGTLLPFYRTPFNFYQEGAFTSETVDGIGVNQVIAPSSPWNAEVSAYAGGFSMVEQSENGLVQPNANKTLGTQIWLNTPISGLRLGWGGQRFDVTGTALVSDGKDSWKSDYASIEYAGSRVKVRSEYRKTRIHDADVNFESYYVYGGVNLTSRLAVHGQFDTSKLDLSERSGQGFTIPKYYQDWTAGLTYSVRPDVVLKSEYHWTKSQLLETNVLPLGAPSRAANYAIFSMSVSF
ncbi:MAG: hypothetical protein ABI672_02025 [Vicinamibacteria bacterium]